MKLPPPPLTFGQGYLGHFPTDLADFLQALGDGGVDGRISAARRSDDSSMSYSLKTRVKISFTAIERI